MNDNDIALVLSVACETQDRTPAEQRAMLDTALHVDIERGRFTTTNRHPVRPMMVRMVRDSYDPSEGRRVDLTAQQRAQVERMAKRWEMCAECGEPLGAHPAEGCPG